MYQKDRIHQPPSFGKDLVSCKEEPYNEICATEESATANNIINAAIKALPDDLSHEERHNIVLAGLQDGKVKDPVEARLCAKEIILYNQAMSYIRRSEKYESSNDSGIESWHSLKGGHVGSVYLKFALKLLRLHGEVVNDIEKYRRRGQQQLIYPL